MAQISHQILIHSKFLIITRQPKFRAYSYLDIKETRVFIPVFEMLKYLLYL